MASVYNNNALDAMLRELINNAAPTIGNLRLRLFTNSLTPSNTDAVGAYTECVDSLYAAAVLAGGTWTLSAISNGKATIYPAVTFTFSGSNSLYGWYLTDSANAIVYGAGNFVSPPVIIPVGGGTYSVQVTLPLTVVCP